MSRARTSCLIYKEAFGSADHPARIAVAATSRRHVLQHEAVGADHASVTDGNALDDDGVGTDVAAGADRSWRAFDCLRSPREDPPDRVVRVEMHAGRDRTVVAYRQAARAVENREGSDPGAFAHLHAPH